MLSTLYLEDFPTDVLIHISQYQTLKEQESFFVTCKAMKSQLKTLPKRYMVMVKSHKYRLRLWKTKVKIFWHIVYLTMKWFEVDEDSSLDLIEIKRGVMKFDQECYYLTKMLKSGALKSCEAEARLILKSCDSVCSDICTLMVRRILEARHWMHYSIFTTKWATKSKLWTYSLLNSSK